MPHGVVSELSVRLESVAIVRTDIDLTVGHPVQVLRLLETLVHAVRHKSKV